uniref:CCHC-type domain-containing protein n=1 Tax=Neogobius melanostomus TaxID=47308 RepID=A0A8C6WHB1_9GOBI
MDSIANSGVDITRSVLVTGVTKTSADDDVHDYLREYGSLKTLVYVSDPKSPFYKNLIAEYENASAFAEIRLLLPCNYRPDSAPDHAYRITTLASECGATAGSSYPTSDPTPDFMRSFKEMADRSGTRFEDVLKTVMTQIHQHLEMSGTADDKNTGNENDEINGEGGQDSKVDIGSSAQPVSEPLVSLPASLPSSRLSFIGQPGARPRLNNPTETRGPGYNPRVSLSRNDLNPPEIQRVVVEHVVRNADLGAPMSLRLRSFSGRLPKPNNEADYESWRSQTDLLLADPTLSPLHVTRRIIESLLTPAADLVRGLGPDTLPVDLLRVLDSAFGTVQDGEELYAQYLNILQNPGERPSFYLQRLQLMLNVVVRRRGISAAETDRHLLRQFVRGCWDNAVLMKLQLDQRKDNPPPFSELLLLLRTEEDRQQAKESLMKKHISSSTKPKADIKSQSTCSCGHTSSSELKELKEQMKQLQLQMSAFLSAQKIPNPAGPKPAPRQSSRSSATSVLKPKPWYCFNCGEDGHMSSSCTDAANPSLVEQKRKQL